MATPLGPGGVPGNLNVGRPQNTLRSIGANPRQAATIAFRGDSGPLHVQTATAPFPRMCRRGYRSFTAFSQDPIHNPPFRSPRNPLHLPLTYPAFPWAKEGCIPGHWTQRLWSSVAILNCNMWRWSVCISSTCTSSATIAVSGSPSLTQLKSSKAAHWGYSSRCIASTHGYPHVPYMFGNSFNGTCVVELVGVRGAGAPGTYALSTSHCFQMCALLLDLLIPSKAIRTRHS